jgi:hypothetical protein
VQANLHRVQATEEARMRKIEETDIRSRAYALWQQDGSPEGREQEFWSRAERELAEEADLDTSEAAAEITQPTPPAGLPIH